MEAVGAKSMVLDALREIDAETRRLKAQRHELEALSKRRLVVPQSIGEWRGLLDTALATLPATSREFGRLLRKLVPEFHVYLVRACDGGHPLPRARVTLALDGIVPDARHVAGLPKLLTKTFTLDLFEETQRVRIREQAAALAAAGHGPKAIANLIAEKP